MRITVIMRKCTVALLAEGVDRNIDVPAEGAGDSKSLSSRRAWIEIHITEDADGGGRVALLAEGVDRNTSLVANAVIIVLSPSSRRAWIEIRLCK